MRWVRVRARLMFSLLHGIVLAPALLLLLVSSCVAPVTWGPGRLGAGVFVINSRVITPPVQYVEVRGVGIMVVDRRLCLGAIDTRWVQAEIEGQSYTARTPLAVFAVGAAAQENAREFLQENGGIDRRQK